MWHALQMPFMITARAARYLQSMQKMHKTGKPHLRIVETRRDCTGLTALPYNAAGRRRYLYLPIFFAYLRIV